jgi:TolA-binding protein
LVKAEVQGALAHLPSRRQMPGLSGEEARLAQQQQQQQQQPLQDHQQQHMHQVKVQQQLQQVQEREQLQQVQEREQLQHLQLQEQSKQQQKEQPQQQQREKYQIKEAVARPLTAALAGQPRQHHAGSVVGGRQSAVCAACGAAEGVAGARLHLCRGCRLAWFCSDACYKGYWPAHKAVCSEEQARRAGHANTKMGHD